MLTTTIYVTNDKMKSCCDKTMFNNMSKSNEYTQVTYYHKNLRKIVKNKNITNYVNVTIIDIINEKNFIIEKKNEKSIDEDEFPFVWNYEYTKIESVCECVFE